MFKNQPERLNMILSEIENSMRVDFESNLTSIFLKICFNYNTIIILHGTVVQTNIYY